MRLAKRSKELIQEVFGRYTEEELPNRRDLTFDGRIVIHLYAERDTQRGKNLDGFVDSLLFEARIYDTTSSTFYRISGRDGMRLHVKASVRIFKDGSTMVVVDGPCSIQIFQELQITTKE